MSQHDSSARGTQDPGASSPAEPTGIATPHLTPSHFVEADGDDPDLQHLRLGRYTVLGTVGRGGVGVVYAAYDPDLDRKIAIKLLAGLDPSPRSRARLQREAQAMARLSHPNVVAVHDVGTYAGQVFLAMEYVGGGTLREWMGQRRAWREVLDMFRRAGEGLQAAHAAGLVHRDFKPENVLVTATGQPKVTDFGLVRAIHDEPQTESESESESESGSDLDDAQVVAMTPPIRLETPITHEGAVLGTPAYMAPEQLRGEEADVRADQYAFCVSFYEALWGHRPYLATTDQELSRQIHAHQRVPRLSRRDVPPWIAEIVERGLSLGPDERWPSMQALLDALADDPMRRRRRWLAGLAGAGMVAALAAGFVAHERWQVQTCAGAGAAVETVWTPETRETIERAMLTTEVSYAPDTWALAAGTLDQWAERWRAARVDACGDRVPEAGSRVACLDEQLDVLAGILDVLAETDRRSLGHAYETLAALPDPQLCSDRAWLAASRASFGDPGQTSALRRELARVRALELAGRYEDAEAVARAVVTRTESSGRSPLRVEALVAHGRASASAGAYAEARAAFEEAHHDARAIGYERLAFEASLGLAEVLGAQAEPKLAQVWVDLAGASVEHLGSRRADVARARAAQAGVHELSGDYEAAEAELREALELAESVHDPGHPFVATIEQQLGTVVSLRGRYAEARELLERTRARRVDNLGLAHPELATTDLALAHLDFELGEFEVALVRCERALALREQAFGRAHPDTVEALNNVALVEFELGRPDQALALQREVAALREQIFGAEHPKVGSALINMSFMLHAGGQLEEAQAVLERAVDILERAHGPSHPSVIKAVNNLAVLQMSRGQLEAARGNLERARAGFIAAFGPDHEKVALALFNLGSVEFGLGRKAEGLAHMRQGLGDFGAAVEPRHPRAAELMLILGVSEVESGEAERGYARLELALEVRTEKVGLDDPLRADIFRVLAEVELDAGAREQALAFAEAAFELLERDLVGAADHRAAIRVVLARALGLRGPEASRAAKLLAEARAELELAEPSELRKRLEAELEAL